MSEIKIDQKHVEFISDDGNTKLITGDVLKSLDGIPEKSIDLIISSPPYGIGKSYESWSDIKTYKEWAEKVIIKIKNVLKTSGSVCWQVGTYSGKNGEYIPLDIEYAPIFMKHNFILKNRLIWKFGHGLHSNTRLSGRYEVLLWFVLDSDSYTFNLDTIRIQSKEPGKKSFKGPNKGNLSGNPLGKNPSDVWTIMMDEWEKGIWDFPNVKSNHPEKIKEHPCQFPVELAERCVLAFSNENDTVLDPFSGVGTTGVASTFHNRKYVGIDKESHFINISMERIKDAKAGTLKTRKIGTLIQKASKTTKTRQVPKEWKSIIEEQNKKPRLYPQYKDEDE
jgi:adenine-specific DNA-methyltransferase